MLNILLFLNKKTIFNTNSCSTPGALAEHQPAKGEPTAL